MTISTASLRSFATRHIFFLAFFSGVCGLAYEILYARLLSSYIGNIFYVTAAILASFLVSYGVGSLFSYRWARFLPHIEIAIGLYGAVCGALVTYSGFSITKLASIGASVSPLLLVGLCFVFLAIPAFLIGFSIPLFTRYVVEHHSDEVGFHNVYIFYNIGAACAVLLIEFFLVRTVGIFSSILVIALVNVAVGTLLFFVAPPRDVDTPPSTSLSRRNLAPLFLAGVGSGVFQILIIKLSHFIFGPFNENFAIILSSALVGIALGSVLSVLRLLSFRSLLLLCAIATLVPIILIEPFANVYSVFFFMAESSWGGGILAKVAALLILTLPVFVLYGGTIPHFIPNNADEAITRRALAWVSFGNALGYLLFVFFLYERLPESIIAALAALLFLAGAMLIPIQNKSSTIVVGVAVAQMALLGYLLWPSYLHDVGYRAFFAPESLERARTHIAETVTFKKYSSSATISENKSGTKIVALDGYVSLGLGRDGSSRLSETIVGLAAAFFSAEHHKALVFGLGTGITGGATAAVYGDTTIAEINPAMPALTAYFDDENFHVLRNPNAHIVLQDAILTLFDGDDRYDAIVNTVPSPTFFSSNKLWTKDVFDAVAKKLKPGGVFVGWLDYYVGDDGFNIMHNTLHASFADCVYVYLTPAYFGFVCSNESLNFSARSDEELGALVREQFDFYELGVPVSDFMHSLLLSPAPLGGNGLTDDINTLDLPHLEFVYTTGLRDDGGYFDSYLNDAMRVEPFTERELSPAEIRARCLLLESYKNSPHTFCE